MNLTELTITRGPLQKACKTIIYGPEGIGKSTLASQFPSPLFIDAEGSTTYMDVARTPVPESFQDVLDIVDYVKANPGICRTLIIDTMDAVERMASDAVCRQYQVDGIETIGYGKGYTYLKERILGLLARLEQVSQTGINVVIVAHAIMRKFEQPNELGAFDRYELKLAKGVGPVVKEWSDMVLFAGYKAQVVHIDNRGTVRQDGSTKDKNKAISESRVLYTTHKQCWDAKNRFGLPDELPLAYDSIKTVIEACQPAAGPKPVPKAPADRWKAYQADMSAGLVTPDETGKIYTLLAALGKDVSDVLTCFEVDDLAELSGIAAQKLIASLEKTANAKAV